MHSNSSEVCIIPCTSGGPDSGNYVSCLHIPYLAYATALTVARSSVVLVAFSEPRAGLMRGQLARAGSPRVSFRLWE